MSQYPEHDKLAAVADRTQAIGEFLDWVQEIHSAVLCTPNSFNHWWAPTHPPIRDLLAQWAGIDQEALEREKRAMLESLRRRGEQT